MKLQGTLVAMAAALAAGAAHAQISDGVIKIGVLNDMSGLYADLTGPGSVVAARRQARQRLLRRSPAVS